MWIISVSLLIISIINFLDSIISQNNFHFNIENTRELLCMTLFARIIFRSLYFFFSSLFLTNSRDMYYSYFRYANDYTDFAIISGVFVKDAKSNQLMRYRFQLNTHIVWQKFR